MAVTASSVGTGDTLETFRQEFNNAVVDLGNLDSATVSAISISANNSTDESAFLVFVDGATGSQGLESDTALTYNPSSNLLTTGSIVIADAGNIGSSSDTNAIGISSGGVVSITATTANSSTTDGALTVAGGLGVAGNTSIGGTLTVTGTTTLNGALNLGDAAGDALAINATTTVNENMTFTDNDKALFGTGADMELYHDASNSYIANKTGALKIATETSGIAITLGHSTSEVTVADNLTVTGNLTVSGTSTIVDTVTMNAANALIFEGATADAHETTLTIVDPTADRTINLPNVSGTIPVLAAVSTTQVSSTPEELNILDGATVVVGEINALDLGSTAVGNAIASKAVILDSNKDYTGIRNFTIDGDLDVGDDLFLTSDSAQVTFGANSEVTLTHVHDSGLALKHTATADDKPITLVLQTGETDIAANDVIGAINFQAPDEGTGTDAILVAAGIEAVSEGNFSSSNNATKLSFKTGASEAAAEKMSLSSAGLLTIADDLMIKDGGTIGVASTNDAMTISSAGIVTFKDDIIIKDGGTIGSSSDTDAITISSGGVVTVSATTANTSASDGALVIGGGVGVGADLTVGDDLRLITDSAVLSFGADSDTTLTHTDGTGLTLNSTNKLTFGDAASFVQQSSDGVLRVDGEATIDLNASTAVTVSNDLKLDSDAAVLGFGSGNDVTLTHVHDTGLLLNAAMQLQFRDSALNISSSSDGKLDIDADTEVEIATGTLDIDANVTIDGSGANNLIVTQTAAGNNSARILASHASYTGNVLQPFTVRDTNSAYDLIECVTNNGSAVPFRVRGDGLVTALGGYAPMTADGASLGTNSLEFSDLFLADGALINFGNDQDVSLAHVADIGLTITNTNTADNKPVVLQLKSEEDAIVANEVIASIEMAAGDSDGTDAATVAAGIHAIAEGTFSASANATKLVFTCGVSETAAASATAKMTLASDGDLTLAGTVTADATATLLIKNSSGSTLKTINGIAAN